MLGTQCELHKYQLLWWFLLFLLVNLYKDICKMGILPLSGKWLED